MVLLAQLAKERFDYPRRSANINGVRSWIARGDFDMGRSFARTIIKRQQNLREAAAVGLLESLSSRLQQLAINVLHYPGRSNEISAMNAWIESGDFAMGATYAESILRRQNGLRLVSSIELSDRLKTPPYILHRSLSKVWAVGPHSCRPSGPVDLYRQPVFTQAFRCSLLR